MLHRGTVGGVTYSPTPTPVVVETGGDNGLRLRAWTGDAGEVDDPDVPGDAAGPTGTGGVDSPVYTGGDTSQQTLTVESPSGGTVRDVVPAEWTVLEEGPVRDVELADDVKLVYFEGAAPGGEEATFHYRLEAPADLEETGYYEFGPPEIRLDGAWVAVEGAGGEAFVAVVDG